MRLPGTSCDLGPVAFDVLLLARLKGVVHLVVFAPDTRERVRYLQFGCGDDDGGGEYDDGRKLKVFIGKKGVELHCG
jgi:hypothetical protein